MHKVTMIKSIFLFAFICVQSCNTQAVTLFVEGNIGVGKSTFLQILSEHLPDVNIVVEPVDEWQNISGYNLLDAFYRDGARWACTFQLYALMTRIRKQQNTMYNKGSLQILERSWYSDYYCFAKNCYLLGMMNDMEWQLYSDMWQWHIQQITKPAGVVYLRADPETCYQRIKVRNRGEEQLVPFDYIKMLHERHEEWLVENKYNLDIPVLILDGSCNFLTDLHVQQDFVQQILDFFKKHGMGTTKF